MGALDILHIANPEETETATARTLFMEGRQQLTMCLTVNDPYLRTSHNAVTIVNVSLGVKRDRQISLLNFFGKTTMSK